MFLSMALRRPSLSRFRRSEACKGVVGVVCCVGVEGGAGCVSGFSYVKDIDRNGGVVGVGDVNNGVVTLQ